MDKIEAITSRVIGKTIEDEPINVYEIGNGKKKTALIIGVPHSDEPLGSLVTTFFIRWLALNKEYDCFGWRWLFIPILERRGMRLNEGWFNMPGSFAAMAKANFREPTEDQYEWSFPIQYEDYEWTKSRPETLAVKSIIEKEKPDLLCGLHHCGFSNGYYYLSDDIPDLYPELRQLAKDLRIPLSKNAPDVPFGKMLSEGFYKMYGLKDYLDYYKKRDPNILLTIKRGACSDEWYQDEIGGFSFNCEVPLFLSTKLQDNKMSNRSYTHVLGEKIKRKSARIQFSRYLIDRIKKFSDLADPLLFDVALKHLENAEISLKHEIKMLSQTNERLATNAEVFENEVLADLFDIFFLGQFWRVAESICIKGGSPNICRFMDKIDLEIKLLSKQVHDQGNFYSVPIRTAVKMQLGSILIISDALLKDNVDKSQN